MPEPEPIREEPVQSPAREEEPPQHPPPQHPPHVYRAMRLTEPLEALLHQIAARCDETAQQIAESDRYRAAWEARVERRLDRYEDLVQWAIASEHARCDRSQLPPFPEPRVYADDFLVYKTVLYIKMLHLFFAVAFSAVPLTLYVPPIRSFNLFVQTMEDLWRESSGYTHRVYPRVRYGGN
ncbi:hypothetical protein R6Q57_015428 [Mikania cordata]